MLKSFCLAFPSLPTLICLHVTLRAGVPDVFAGP